MHDEKKIWLLAFCSWRGSHFSSPKHSMDRNFECATQANIIAFWSAKKSIDDGNLPCAPSRRLWEIHGRGFVVFYCYKTK